MRLPDQHSVRSIAGAFVASRLLVLFLIVLFAQLDVVKTTYGGRVTETRIDLRPDGDVAAGFVKGDAEWFRSIAEDGYAREPFRSGEQRNWAFFPLFPLAVRYLGFFSSFTAAGVVLSNLFFALGLFALHILAVRAGFSEEVATRACMYACFFPASYFFSVPVSESLFLLLGSGSAAAASGGRWWTAGVLGALASATRVHGILLLLLLGIVWLQRSRRWRDGLPLLLVPGGVSLFCLFLWRATGNAFAFVDIQQAWQRGPGPLMPLMTFVRDLPVVSTEWNFRLLNVAFAVLLVVATWKLFADRQPALGTYVAACLAIALASGSLQSIGRYCLTAFPLFVALASFRIPERAHQVLTLVSAMLLGALTTLYALNYDLAMA